MPFQIYPSPSHFSSPAEFGTGFHIASTYPQPGQMPDIFIIFSQEFVLPIDEIFLVDPVLRDVPAEDLEAAVRQNPVQFNVDLQPCPSQFFTSHPLLAQLTSGPGGLPSAAPAAPGTAPPVPTPYGHLPFARQTVTDHEHFVRYTLFQTDHRVMANGAVLPGTFAAPASEERVVPNGFAAVGRFALPSLHPAIWRRDIVPPAATLYFCGAVVPMFGQAGGGAEVKFDRGAHAGSAHLRSAKIPEL